ncbi:MAG: peptide ABC transporter substrate-binding protein [Pyrinomonadaceae bacterium]
MKPQIYTDKHGWKIKKISVYVCVNLCLIFPLLFSGCSQLEKPQPEPFYAETAPPQKKEFRWSNGKTPKSFDPAKAAAPPETDVVRAVYEGLTDTDAKTLQTVPAIATDWKSSEDFKTWTFDLRKDAKWSNGERVTARDFVRSWKRLAQMGEQVSYPELLQNIVGLQALKSAISPNVEKQEFDIFSKPTAENLQFLSKQSNSNSTNSSTKLNESNANTNQKSKVEKPIEPPFGVEAIDDFTLKISLVKPDKDFPALVAHPLFRPIYGDGKEFETGKLNADIVTSGAFRIFSIGQDGITLDRAETYWNKAAVELERVRFVPTENAEKALAAYRAGEIDAVTNADFEPLALKLLTPFEDFRRTEHAALNFYEFNQNKPPFDDRRVREALATAIERERLTDDEMDGASKPALKYTPFGDNRTNLKQDVAAAQNLFREAGYPNGENFPIVKLVVNRNNTQQRIARSVAKMWKQNLNVETEIVVKDSSEIAASRASADYDVLRRGVVLPTTDEAANMQMIISPVKKMSSDAVENKAVAPAPKTIQENGNSNLTAPAANGENAKIENKTGRQPENKTPEPPATGEMIATEAEAMNQLSIIPLYFPTSYSLVKPYIQGFETNVLDAPSLKDVRIDNNWQPEKTSGES